MDGEHVRRVTFRVEHDCPLAQLSRALPHARIRAWSGHHFEVVELRAERTLWRHVEDTVKEHLDPLRILPTPEGGLAVWRPHGDSRSSITRRLEAHDLMWLQPLQVQNGWEHYDAIAFGPTGEQAALDDLQQDFPTQVVRRQWIGAGDVAAALFLSLHPVLGAPTDKQAEALLAADEMGYYHSPRGTTTAKVAERLGIGRSAFEERLRGAENRVMEHLLPAMRWYRQHD